jgi:hypothetical protein
MLAPFNNVRSKLNRAIVAYLINCGNCGGPGDIFPANSGLPKTFPNTIVKATIAKPEPNFTGSYRIPVWIKVRGSAGSNNQNTDLDAQRFQFDQRLGFTQDNLMMTSDQQTLLYTAQQITACGRALVNPIDQSAASLQFAKNNADMADFTCQNWYDDGMGDGEPDEEGCDWVEIFQFIAVCCGSNVD